MASARAIKRQQALTYRMRVLAVVNNTDQFFSGQQIAQLAGLTHKQTIDALNALNNMAKVARVGRKFTARWGRIPPVLDECPALVLQNAFHSFFK